MKEKEILIVLEYFLRKEGAWEKYLNNVNEKRVKARTKRRPRRYIMDCFAWAVDKSINWSYLYPTFYSFLGKIKIVKITEISKTFYKNQIIAEKSGYLIVEAK